MGLYVWSYDYPSTCEAILSDIGKFIPYLMQQITANVNQMHISLDVLFLFWAKNSMTSGWLVGDFYCMHRTYQKRQFRVIQAIRSGQVTCQELGQSNPSTRWGGSPT